ncbi:hypothetical protein LM597_00615 [Candidatus Acetothermia bacterium]|jgi:hypothetical protein|nr:hypothetical protein [Candidatus Acetothermia bacterium]MCI2425921.1 hypothetical protein [Candidatus Acetothermia bacterium]MCI2427325.1 hypothetical protein [Candidatus Acetothermia bacterium]MCI2428498.1 hypothetical protein [Candidatus Acetothermia bacterium]
MNSHYNTNEALIFWIQTNKEAIHFIDGIITAYDGVANVRRDYTIKEGKTYFKVFVADGMDDEFFSIIERCKKYVPITDIVQAQ